MDGQRFDNLVKRFAGGISRRTVLKGLAGGAVATAATVASTGKGFAQNSCDDATDCVAGQICCDGICTDDECCFTSDCPLQNECLAATSCIDNTCIYAPQDVLCNSDACEVCNTSGFCEPGCIPSDLGPCCNAQCAAGECVLFSDDDLCVAGTCFQCDGNTGQCAFTCDTGEVCCNNECLTGDCCDAGDCTEALDCQSATCTETRVCSYEFDDSQCNEGCQYCNDGLTCIQGCPDGQVCCNSECVAGDCCTPADCTETGECLAAGCVANTCIYMTDDSQCDSCETCQQTGACDSDCISGEVCCDETCHEGNCCTAGDCALVTCAVVSCTSNVCGVVSLCPPTGGINNFCCPSEFGDYCYNTLERGECCIAEADELCDAVIDPATCFAGVCTYGAGLEMGLCGIVPDDSRCDKNQCCCELDGSCSADCCETSDCKVDHDCGKDECCCKDGSCSSDCCESTRDCTHDHECDKGECCCRNGVCSSHCCKDPGCQSDNNCADGACCCKNGACAFTCCDKPDDDTPQIETLPNTGAGPTERDASWIAGVAAIAGAAALLGSKATNAARPAGEPES